MKCQRRYKQIVAKYKKKDTRSSMLLKTYLTSLLSLALCAAMLLGTTMAWFTDEVGSGGNEIHIGNLEMDFSYSLTGDSPWTSLKTPGEATTQILDADTKWYPGLLKIVSFEVKQEGDLAFTYSLGAQLLDAAGNKVPECDESTENTGTEGSGMETADPYQLAEYFEVYVYTGNMPTDTSINSIKAENSGWMSVGTLKDVLQGTPVKSGTMAAKAGPEYIRMAIYMKPETPSSYINQSLENIYIYLLAYQSEGTEDVTVVNNAADLAAALQTGGTVVLSDDMTIPDGARMTVTGTATLNLNGKNLTGEENVIAILANGEDAYLTLEGDGKVDGGAGGNNVAVCANGGGTVRIMDGTYTVGEDKDGVGNSVVYAADRGKVEIYGGTYYTDVAYNGLYYVLNCQNGSGSMITVYGGTFKNFDPSKGDDSDNPTNFVAEGYHVEEHPDMEGNTWYTVVPDAEGQEGN